METKSVNPMIVQTGDSIVTGPGNKSTKITHKEFCPTQPESVHLNHMCFDSRFATVALVVSQEVKIATTLHLLALRRLKSV